MTQDKPTVRISRPGDLAGAVPHLAGYQPTENQVAVLGFGGTNYAGAAMHTWTADMGEGPTHAVIAVQQIVAAFGDRAESYLAIGYGPDGPERALLVQDALAQHPGITAQAWAVNDGQLRMFAAGHGWSPQIPLEATAGTEVDMVTGKQPAASRDELTRRYAPVPEHQQATLAPATAERFAALPPSVQYDWASTVLTEGARSKTGLTDEHVALIAHAAATNEHTRDNLLHDVIGDTIKADRLVDAFRRCDDARRPDMADLAAAGQFITRGSTVGIEAITRYTTGELGRLANKAAALGLDPQPWIDSLDRTELRDRLGMADRHHYRSHVMSESPLLPNPDPRAPTRPAPGAGYQPRQHPGAWKDMDR